MLLSTSLSLLLVSRALLAPMDEVPAASADPVPVERIAEARKVLEDSLRDYEATKFRDTFARKGAGDSIQFCGQWNSVNGFGAPTGWRNFYVTVGHGSPIIEERSCGDITEERISPTDYAPALSAQGRS